MNDFGCGLGHGVLNENVVSGRERTKKSDRLDALLTGSLV